MSGYSSNIVFANWDKYCDKAKKILADAGLYETVGIDPGCKARSGDTRHVLWL